MEWIASGFVTVFTLQNITICTVSAFLGTLVGVLPGLGPVASIALLFPFTLYLDTVGAVIALGGIYYGAMFGGAVTSVLLNVPGEVAAVPTAIEGYPLAMQGRGAQTLIICMLSSFFGSMVSLAALAFFGPILADMALKFGPFEYFVLMIFSISCASGLGKGSMVKGFAAAAIGMLMAMVGVDTETGIFRMTYGLVQLYSGIEVIAVVVGVFGICEVLVGIRENVESVSSGTKYRNKWPSMRELRLSFKAAIKGSLIGCFGGMLPGITPSTCAFLSYSINKRTGEEKEKFGKGAIEGCAGGESANNAAAMSGFIPLLALGIPTTALLAIILSAMIIHGVVPGPLMFSVHMDLTSAIIASFFIGNVICLLLNIPFAGFWAKIAELPYKWLAPVVLFLCMLGTQVINNSHMHLWIMVIFGLVGLMVKKTGFSLPAMILGLLLGKQLEIYFRQTMVVGFSNIVDRPIAIGVIVATVVMLYLFSKTMKNME